MKLLKSLVCLAVISVVTACAAQDIGYSTFSTSGIAINPGTNYAIIPANSRSGREPQVTYLNVNGFSVNAINVTSYVSTNRTVATAASFGTTNYVASTNGFTVGNWVVITHLQQLPRFRNEAALISAVQATNQVVLATASTTAIAAGDRISYQTANGTLPIVQSATTAREVSNAGGIISGQREEPLLITVISAGAGTNTINVANSVFAP